MPKLKPSTISRDPYAAKDAYAFLGKPSTSSETKLAEPPPQQAAKPRCEKITVTYPVELIERARNAAYWDRMTLAGIMEQALIDGLDRMEKGRGDAYPPRPDELRGGRPVGSRNRK